MLSIEELRERDRQRHRDRYHSNIEQGRATSRLKFHRKAEKRRAANSAYKRAFPEANAERQQMRRVRERDAFVEHVHPLAVLEMADGVCGICGEDVNPNDFHVDHVVPLALGGEHSYANTQPAHPVCNWRKAATSPA